MSAPILAFITRNSYSKMLKAPVSFLEVLESTLQVPYKHIILVDDSMDETRKVFKEWCSKHGKEPTISSSKTYGNHRATRATNTITLATKIFGCFIQRSEATMVA